MMFLQVCNIFDSMSALHFHLSDLVQAVHSENASLCKLNTKLSVYILLSFLDDVTNFEAPYRSF